MKKRHLFPLIVALITLNVHAEPSRTFYSLENRLPRWEQLETGVTFAGAELESETVTADAFATALYLRYGLLDDLAVRVDVPFVQVDPDFADSESGIGDVELSLQLRAYEDIFGYPYFLPYVTVGFPTGDEDKGLGAGDTTVTAGISYGSRIHDWIDWVLDVSYIVNSDVDNQIVVGHSYVWNVSDDFGILTEFLYEQADTDGEDDDMILSAGFTYNWSSDLEMGVSIGAGLDGVTDVIGGARLSYSF